MRAFAVVRILPFLWFASGGTAQQAEAAPVPDLVEWGTKIDALCRPLVDGDALVGFAVGVLERGARLERGYGQVARGGAQPDSDTTFEIGSVSKVFTGVLLADAVERKLVQLDDPVAKYLPDDAAMPTFDGAPVLLWHLATHTSGLPRLPDMTGALDADPYAHIDRQRLLAALPKAKVRWQPGSKYEYSNFAVGLLGEVLVRVNGKASYDELLRERIAKPCGMAATGVVLDQAQRQRLADPFDGDGEPSHTWDLAALAGAGGIRSSLRDMLWFARANVKPDMVPALAGALRLAQAERYKPDNGVAMGLGWHFTGDHTALWHNGETGGYHSWLWIDPAHERAICVLANTASGLVDRLGERIAKVIAGGPVEPIALPPVVAVERAALQRCVGRYRVVGGPEFVVDLRERGLFARLGNQPWLRLWPQSPTEFAYRGVDAQLTFEIGDDAATARAVVLHQNGRDVTFARLENALK